MTGFKKLLWLSLGFAGAAAFAQTNVVPTKPVENPGLKKEAAPLAQVAPPGTPGTPPVGKNLPPTPPANPDKAAAADKAIPIPPPPAANTESAPAEAQKDLPPPEDDLPPPPGQANSPTRVENLPPVPDANLNTSSAQKVAPNTAKVKITDKKGAEGVAPGQELVNIDFPEPTEIKDIVRAVAVWMNKNVILDRNVSGKIQIISPKKVTKEEAYQAFLSALNVLQFTTVETGKVIKIVPIRQAVRGNLRTFMGSKWTPLTDEIITQIVPLKYVDARSIQNTLSRIVSPSALIAYEKTNTLIISDSGYKVKRILDILELIDVQGQQPQVSIVPIRFADAKFVSEKVNDILKANSSTSGQSQGFKISPDERSNSVIVFGPPRTIQDVTNLVKKFDIELDDPSRQNSVHVRPLDYADAKKLASTLSALAQGNKQNTRRPPTSVATAGVPGAPPIVRASSSEPDVAELSGDVKITADESSNSLLITGSRAAYQAINSIIRKLDVRKSQVYVEADILDIDLQSGFNFGTAVFGGFKRGENIGITTWEAGNMSGLISSQAVQNQDPTAKINDAAAAKIADTFKEDMTIGILSGQTVNIPGLGKISPGALIKTVKTDANTRILSSPQLLVANNEEAKFAVGKKEYFRTSEANPTTGTSVPKVDSVDADLSLNLKPNISNTNSVTIKLDLDANSVALNQVGLPSLNKRKTSQTLTVKNGQTVVISGLVQTQEYQKFKKIPLLGDIPILGWLFRNSETGNRKSNLIIFLTPHVIHGADDMAAIYQQKLKENDEFMESVYGSNFRDDKFYALIPGPEDGKYTPDALDEAEKRRRDEILKSIYQEQYGDRNAASAETMKGKANEPVSVPANATVPGSTGSGDASLSAPPPPPGASSPVPIPVPGGDDGGSQNEPPPPGDFEPPPPPPPPEVD